jgi:VCBS repeat-containing protein
MNIGLRQSGFTIIEGLIAFLIMTASGLALALFLPKMLGESSTSSNYTLASNFAQDKLESLRQFATETACTTMTSGSDSGASASASFDRTWTVAACPNSLKCKTVTVNVGWTDAGGQSKNVNLSTNTECYDPVQSGIALVAISTGSESLGGGSVPGNNAPVAADDSVTVTQNSSATINVLSNDTDADGDALTLSIETQPLNGGVTLVSGNYVYTPDTDFTGSDSFIYFASDGKGGSDTATVSITVSAQAVNNAPNAVNDSDSVTEDSGAGQIATGNVISNDSDPDPDQLTVTGFNGGNNYGNLVLNSDGTYTYTLDNDNTTVQALNSGETRTDSYTYTLSDGTDTDTANLVITINGVDEPESCQIAVSSTKTPIDEDDIGEAYTKKNTMFTWTITNSGLLNIEVKVTGGSGNHLLNSTSFTVDNPNGNNQSVTVKVTADNCFTYTETYKTTN